MRAFFKGGLVLLAMLVLFSGALPALENIVDFSPVFQADADEPLLPDTMIMRSLQLSGLSPGEERYEAAFSGFLALKELVCEDSFVSLPEAERAESVLSLMYEKAMTRYSELQTELCVLFERGTYNCVSSSVLYSALALACGIPVFANETPDHAFCTVLVDGKRIDVETTNPYGFNPGTKKDISDENRSRYAVVPAKKYSGRSQISLKMLVMLVGKNLINDRVKKKDYDGAVHLGSTLFEYARSQHLAEGELAECRYSLDSAVATYVNSLDSKSEFGRALALLDAVTLAYGDSSVLDTYYRQEVNNAVANASKRLSYLQSASDLLEEYSGRLDQKKYVELKAMVISLGLDSVLEPLSPDERLDYLGSLSDDYYARNNASLSRVILNRQEIAWSEKVNALIEKEQFLEAVRLSEEAVSQLPQSRNLPRLRSSCLQNHGVFIHNSIVPLVNSQRYEEALSILQEALKDNPGSSMIKNDIKLVQRRMDQ